MLDAAIFALCYGLALLWILSRNSRGRWRATQITLLTVASFVLFVALSIWRALHTLSARGSAGIGAVSIGVSDLLVEVVAVMALAWAAVWALRRFRRRRQR